MGWQFINGRPYRTFGSSWTPQSLGAKVLFWGKVSEISGGQMPNKVTDSSDALTVAGSPYTFQTPNTAAYIAADTDYIWFQTDGTPRTATEAEMIGYDFTRTIVKYGNTSPYTLYEIIILSEALTTAEMNQLRDYADLSIWWDGTLSSHGSLKTNRLGQSVWTPETVYDARAITLFAQMAALGETQTDARKLNISNTIELLKAANLFDGRFDRLIVYRGSGIQSTKLNWIQNAFNAEGVENGGVLSFTNDGGYNSDRTNSYIRSHFIPSSDGVKMKQNDCSFGFKCSGTLGLGFRSHGCWHASSALMAYQGTAIAYHQVNGTGYGGNLYVIGYNNFSRSLSTEFNQDVEGIGRNTVITDSSALPPVEMFTLVGNFDGTPTAYVNERIEFEWGGSAISNADFLQLITIMDAYIASL